MIVFTSIGIVVVFLVVVIGILSIIPPKVFCFFKLHVSNGCYGGGDSSHKGMYTHCVNCGKGYYADEPWMHQRIGGVKDPWVDR